MTAKMILSLMIVLGPPNPQPSLDYLITQLKCKNEASRQKAADALAKLQSKAGPALRAIIDADLEETDWRVQLALEDAITSIGAPAVRLLVEVANDRSRAFEARTRAMDVLARLAPKASDAVVPSLMQLTQDPYEPVAICALRLLGGLKRELVENSKAPLAKRLTRLMTHKDHTLAFAAALDLFELDPENKAAFRELIEEMKKDWRKENFFAQDAAFALLRHKKCMNESLKVIFAGFAWGRAQDGKAGSHWAEAYALTFPYTSTQYLNGLGETRGLPFLT